jgi:hypothetical protein
MDKEQMIRQRAHEIWSERGQPEGEHESHWDEARREIEASSPPEPDANGPTGAELPTGAEVPGGASPAQPAEPLKAAGTSKGKSLKEATELG